MARVVVRILHPPLPRDAGRLARGLAAARLAVAEAHRDAFARAGAVDVEIVREPLDDTPFGARLGRLIEHAAADRAGLVVLGSGSIPRATIADRKQFVAAAGGAIGPRTALANNRFSADVIAIADPSDLPPVPALPSDNAVPRWLAERAGWTVRDLASVWRLQVDLDSPLDAVLLGLDGLDDRDTALVRSAASGIRSAALNRRAEILVAGRTSTATIGWLERSTAARVRAWVEERGLRAGSRLALGGEPTATRFRAPGSILGLVLDRDGPAALGTVLERLADAALVDSRVLLAHRLGLDERRWPSSDDRFASDLLMPDLIEDDWLRAITVAAVEARIPVLLGGHNLVGPGVRLVVGAARARPRPPAERQR